QWTVVSASRLVGTAFSPERAEYFSTGHRPVERASPGGTDAHRRFGQFLPKTPAVNPIDTQGYVVQSVCK
ncbi:MAG: hypothetical protein MUD08_13730, partial [Cytophagales bacterium]|nr:hypothetical protein [Cytophagales bacterium]